MERILKIIVGTLVFFLVFEIIQVGAQNVGSSCQPTDICNAAFFEECDGSTCVCMTGYETQGGTQCFAVSCPVLAQPDFGNTPVYSNGQKYQSSVFYTCTTGYEVSGDSTRSCQADKSWSGTDPTCVKKDCGALTTPANGQKSSEDTLYQAQVTFTCDTGYSLVGTAILNCNEQGQWSTTAPTCSIVDCGALADPGNGAVDDNQGTVYLSQVTYSCSAGYDLTGSTTRTCQADGLWSGTSPTCIIKNCGGLGTLTSGSISYPTGTTFASTATATCQTGYDQLGVGTFVCGDDGSWSNNGVLPTCSIKNCGTLPALTNGDTVYSSGTTYSSKATSTCDAGYNLIGKDEANCGETGSWDGTIPTCVVKDCGTLTAPTNGDVSYNTGTQEFGTTATFTCDTGYTLGGASTAECQDDGTWSASTPTCTIADCGVLNQPANGNVFFSQQYEYGSSAAFTCNLGYSLSTTDNTLQCQDNGQWSGTDPFCNLNTCRALVSPDNGNIVTQSGVTYGSTATFVCSAGYEMLGTATLECQASGAWDDSEPVCNIKVCPTITGPTSGSIVSSTGTSYNAQVMFGCNEGYTLQGSITILCQNDATWSGTYPSCLINDCGAIGTPTNGQKTLSTGTTEYLTEATFTCNTGYDLDGEATVTCPASGTWSASAPTCTIKDCGDLDTPSNGLKTAATTTYLSIATFSCFTGYSIDGSPSSTCQADGTWSQPSPTCVIQDCGALTQPTNGVMTNPTGLTTYQSTVSFSCDTGYVLTGSVNLVCGSTGDWSKAEPICVIRDCGALSPPSNGNVDTASGTTYEEIATYSCDTGYTRVGSETRKCQAGGSWSASEPTCEIVDCGSLASPSFGSLTFPGGTEYGAVALYQCDLGYTLTGTNSRTCQADFSWSLTAPTCVINDCGTLAAPTHGVVDQSGGTTYLEVTTFGCDTGYTLDGVVTRTCQANSDWNATSPVCNINDCGTLADPSNGQVNLVLGTVYQSIAFFSCNPGYDLTGDASRTCQADGTWQTPSPTCVIKDCGSLPDPVDGLVNTSSGTVYQSEAAYSCDAGYNLVGVTSRTCTAGGTWSSTAPTCTRKDCGTLAAPVDGFVDLSQGTLFEANATFDCDIGYTLTGTSVRTCIDTGNWGSASPTCVIKDCGVLTAPMNGSVTTASGTTYLEVATYSCDPGYTLTGATIRYCQADASWNDTAPTCVIKDCGMLTAPAHGSVVYTPNTEYQGIATFTCDVGYTRNGVETRECVASGSWADNTPACDINDCGVLPSPSNGVVDQAEGTTYESVSYFTCNTGYTLNGVSNRTCLANSSWADASPVCIINDCGSISNPVDGTVDLSDGTVYQSVAVFMCDTGYNLIGATTRDCLAPGTWEMPFPTCQIKDCGTPVTPDFGFLNVSGATTYQSKISYTCQDGFDLSGAVVRTCDSNGNWTDSDPQCLRRDCGFLPAPDFGSVEYLNGDTLFESVIAYNCSLGFNLTGGTKFRYCQADTSWNGSATTCTTQDCGPLTDIVNGQVSTPGGTTFLQTATYTCNTGYEINGDATRQCNDVGGHAVWTGFEPTCTIKDCGHLAAPNQGSVDLSNGTTYAATAQYTCITGYEVDGLAARVCLSTGSWSGDPPTCQLKDCGALANPANGSVDTSSGTLYGATATYMCDTGYGLVGSTTISCLDTGVWDTAPTCSIDCGTPPTVSESTLTYTGGTLAGATAVYMCDSGYTLNGNTTIICNTTGLWTNEPFCTIEMRNFNVTCFQTSQCITVAATCRDNGVGVDLCLCALQNEYYDSSIDECLADCGDLAAPTNGLINLPSPTAAGQIVRYECNVGYALSGNAVRTCQSNGIWSGTPPICITGCGSLEAPSNGYVNTSNGMVSGKIAVYTCNTGYSLMGTAQRVCLDDSTWNGNAPTCNKDCSTLWGVSHGAVDLALGHWEGSLAIYICDKDYALVGTATRTCQGTGLWTGVPPECVFAIFPDILLVFGSLFILLIIVDIAILSFCLYVRYCRPKKPKEGEESLDALEKKEEEDDEEAYPASLQEKPHPLMIPSMLSSGNMRNSSRRSRTGRITPENTRYHHTPRKPKMDRPLYKYTVKPKTEIPEPVAEPGRKRGRKGSYDMHLEDYDRDGGMNSDDSAQRRTSAPEDDQISLFDAPVHKWESNDDSSRRSRKAPTMADEVQEHGNIRARMNIPPVPDPPVPIQNDSDKFYSEERRRYLKTTMNAYSQNKM